jgi:hypothetical protein
LLTQKIFAFNALTKLSGRGSIHIFPEIGMPYRECKNSSIRSDYLIVCGDPDRQGENQSTYLENEMSKKITGTALAMAAASLFASGMMMAPLAQAADAAGVHCAGGNSCKGSSECKTAKNDCKGMNSCKGQGWVTMKNAKECKEAGGKVEKPKM